MPDLPNETETAADSTLLYAELVHSILSLDHDTWAKLHEFHSARLQLDIRKSLRRWGLLPELVEDIEQETWLTAIRKISEFVWIDEEHFYYWLRAISCKHIWTYRRKQKRFVSFNDFEDSDDGLDDFMDSYVWDGDCIEDTVILHERMEALERAMRDLKPLEREIVIRRMMGETPRELASVYELKPEHLRMLLWRTKRKIEAQLSPSEGDTDD